MIWSAVYSAPQSQVSLARRQSQRSILAPNLPTLVRSLFSRGQARQDTPCPLFDSVGMNLCSLAVVDNHESATLLVSHASLSLVEGQRTLVGEHGE